MHTLFQVFACKRYLDFRMISMKLIRELATALNHADRTTDKVIHDKVEVKELFDILQL